MTKLLIPALTLIALSFASVPARADVPMPECVNNPACNQGGSCSVGGAPMGAPVGVGLVALAAAGALLVRRRRA